MSREPEGDLTSRWESPAGRGLGLEVLRRLSGSAKDRRPSRPRDDGDVLRELPLERVEGRIDLRGLRTPSPEKDGAFVVDNMRFVQLSDLAEFCGVVVRNVDFSSARLPSLRMFGCRFENCLFDRAYLQDLRMWAVEFHDCSFRRADMRYSSLGAPYEGRHLLYAHVDFSGADLRRAVSSTATFRDCDFAGAKLVKTEFGGSRFVRCRFSGLLREVIFQARDLRHREVEPNTMEDVDFSQAQLRWVEFHHLDLDRVTFPQDARHLVVRNWRCVLEHCLAKLGDDQSQEARSFRVLLESMAKHAGPHQDVGLFNLDDFHDCGGSDEEEQFCAAIIRQSVLECTGQA